MGDSHLAGLRATDHGPGLIGNDRQDLFEWPYASLGLPAPPWSTLSRSRHQDDDTFRLLGDRLADSVSAELTFAEWFSRWDAGPWPVIIDRVALSSAGFGPRSKCMPATNKAEGSSVALATLKQHGLAIVSFPNILLITTDAELPKFNSRDRWAEPLAEALAWGCDRTDRFQNLGRWRGEPSPRVVSSAGEEATLQTKLPPGWSTLSFEAASWPKEDAFVYLIDVRSRIVSAWTLGVGCLLAWFWCGRRSVRRRVLVLTLLLVTCLCIEWLLPRRYAFYSAAVYLVTFGLLLIELGFVFRRARPVDRVVSRSGSSLVRRGAGAAVGVALAVLSLGWLVSVQAAVQADQQSVIEALFPYDGQLDPGRPPSTVVIRLADFKRLSLMAQREGPRPASVIRAVDAFHRVTRKGVLDVVVESEIELAATGRAPFTWDFPVAFARGIQVTLDGKRLPVSVESGGARGRVVIPEAGKHLLRIRRSAATKNEDGQEILSVPVNATPFARGRRASSGRPPNRRVDRAGYHGARARPVDGRTSRAN